MNMLARLIIVLFCFQAFRAGYCGAADDVLKLSRILSRADVLSNGLEGEFEAYRAVEAADAPPLDFRLDGLTLRTKGRVWAIPGDVLIEYTGGSDMTFVGKGSPYNDILEVLCESNGTRFDYLPVGTTLDPFANLRVYKPGKAQFVRDRIDANLLDYLNAVVSINGLPIGALLASPGYLVNVDSTGGRYSIRTDPRKSSNTDLDYELTIAGREVECKSAVTTATPSGPVTTQTLVEAELVGERIIPRRIAQRTLIPGEQSPRRDVVLFTPKELETVEFPISIDFFKKYQRDYVVVRGDAKTSNEFVYATPGKFRHPLSVRLAPEANRRDGAGDIRMAYLIVGLVVAVSLVVLGVFMLRNRNDA